MEKEAMVWRGTYGDEKPVPVLRASVTREDGTIFIDHYATEADAWQGLLAILEADAESALQAEQRALAQLAHEKRELEAARRRLVDANVKHLAFLGVSVGEAVGV